MKPIRKVLVANRGEIAVRILRTLERLGIDSVLVHHAVDAGSLAARLAGERVELVGEPPVTAYLDIAQALAACASSGADAVHPGFGFLSENATFARRVTEAGLAFIGPRAETIALMGDK
ncbi:MAG: biotin carboxylase, partial [Burkholderiales bacterium]